MKKIKPALYLALALLLCGCASAPKQQSAVHYYFLNAAAAQVRPFPPAPTPGSAVDKEDFMILHQRQNSRTAQQCAHANAEANATFEEFFGDLNPFVKPMPKAVSDFFYQVMMDTDHAVNVIKKRNNRPRPFRRDATLDPCLGRIGGLAYPSGHTTIARVEALLLAYLAPQSRDRFIARADESADFRILGGVHHPSDIKAGKMLGEELYAEFMANPEFRAKLDGLRQYLAK